MTETPNYFVKVVFDNYDMPFNSVDGAYNYVENIRPDDDTNLPEVWGWNFTKKCWVEC